MATNAQKNFRKQMKEIQKEMTGKKQEQFFSYIENDHIEHYYKPKNRRKIAAISVGSLVPLLWVGYSIYTWLKPLVVQVQPTTPFVQSVGIADTGMFSSKHTRIVNYLNEIRTCDEQLHGILADTNKDFNSILKNKDMKAAYIESTSKSKTILENMVVSLSSMNVPDEMKEHYAIVKQRYDAAYEDVVYCLDTVNSGNANNIAHINFLAEKLNLLSKQQTQQMLAAFDKVGILYQQDNGNITYWYNK